MSNTRAIENRIARQLIHRRAASNPVRARRLITALSIVACLGVLAVVVPGLLWVMLAGSVVVCLGVR